MAQKDYKKIMEEDKKEESEEQKDKGHKSCSKDKKVAERKLREKMEK